MPSRQWEIHTEIGRQLTHNFGHQNPTLFVIVWDRLRFKELRRLNHDSSSCSFHWLPSDDESDADYAANDSDDNILGDDSSNESLVTIAAESSALAFGVIVLRSPGYLHEKGRAKLPGYFLFGRKARQRRIDVCLCENSNEISRVHFGISTWKGCWFVENFGNETIVNNVFILRRETPRCALNPDSENTIQVGEWKFDVYCRDTYIMHDYVPELSGLRLDDSDEQSQTTSIAASRQNLPPSQTEFLYIFNHRELESISPTRKFIALDPWSFQLNVAKTYPLQDRETLEQRLKLLDALPIFGPFIPDTQLQQQGKRLYLLSTYREGRYPLSQLRTPGKAVREEAAARRLLWGLLRHVANLHKNYGIVHMDIGMHKILVHDDHGFETDDIVLAGFSKATDDMDHAREDCRRIFWTVKDYLGPLASSVPKSWLGNKVLDRLWALCNTESTSWPCDVLDLCRQLDINLDRNDEMWATIEVTKTFDFSLVQRGEKLGRHAHKAFHLTAEEVMEYLAKDVVAKAREASSSHIQQLTQTARKALESRTEDGLISVESYLRFTSHMWDHHSSSVGESLEWRLPQPVPGGQDQTESPITIVTAFKVPYKSRFGLVNIEYLRWLAPPSFNPEILRPLLENCLEIRGLPRAQGVYIPVMYLDDMLLDALQVRFDSRQIDETRDESLDKYTHEHWYLLAPNESSDLFPVRRETKLVHLSSSETKPLGQFLEEYSSRCTYLDSETPHKPEWLITPKQSEQHLISCQGSTSFHSSEDRFKFGKRPCSPAAKRIEDTERLETGNQATDATAGETNSHPRTAEWVSQQPAKRRRTPLVKEKAT